MKRLPRQRRKREAGYMLLEVILATTIFAIAMVGLFRVLQVSMSTSNDFARDTAIRYGLQSIITEARHKDLEEMNLEQMDEEMEIAYRTEVEPLPLDGENGNLANLYKLTATATFLGNYGEEQVKAEVWIYRDPEAE